MKQKILKSRLTSLVLLCMGIAMMYIGVHRGEALVVMNKAIRVCMECIGIG
nr:CD1871A family CXXC motif-containing protein [uncultured Oribacterium sp.]